MYYTVELTRGRERQLVERIELTVPTSGDAIDYACDMVRAPTSGADGFRIFDPNGKFRAAAWMGEA